MSQISSDEDIKEDVEGGTSSINEESNQFYEDMSSSSSSDDDKHKKQNKSLQKQEQQQSKKSKSSISSYSSNQKYEDDNYDEDQNDEYKQDFEQEEQDKPKIIDQNINVELKQSQQQQQINSINAIDQNKKKEQQQQSDYVIEKYDNKNEINQSSPIHDSLKNTIDDKQLKQQQLNFIENLNKFVQSKQQLDKIQKDQSQIQKDNQNKINSSKPPIPNNNKQNNYIKDYLESSPEYKNDIETVPNDQEIEDIIRKNQNNFLNMINGNPQRPSSFHENSSYESTMQYQQEDEDLDVIYETDREDSQMGQGSHNESQDNHFYSEYSIYQQYSYFPGEENIIENDTNDYYENKEQSQQIDKDNRINQNNKMRKLTQEQYERIINQKKLELQQLQEIQKMKENLNINIDENDENMQYIVKQTKLKQKQIQQIKILQDRMKYGCRKCAEANPQKDRESLREENEYLRKVINDNQAQIKILKVQLRKTGDRALDNSFSSIGSVSTSVSRKLEDLENEKEKLKQDNLQLRNTLKELKNQSQSKLSRQQKINNEIQKVFGQDLRSLQEKELKKPVDTKLEIQFRQSQERITELRLDLEKMIKKYEDQKQKIKDKDEQIIILKQKVQGRHFSKQIEKIEQLQNIVDNYEKDKEQIRDEMSLDKQLQLMFPNSIVSICHFFNICIATEQIKKGKYQMMGNIIYKSAKPYLNRIANFFQIIKDSIKFSFTKKPIDHPHQQEIIRATVKAWNESPDLLARQLRSQQKELKELRIRFVEMDKEIEQLTERNKLLEKDVELLRQRNNIIETKLTSDKNKLINNVIVQLKYHAVEDEEEDYLKELKQLINLIKEGPPILISQAEKDEFKRQQELEAQKERKKKEMEERKILMQIKKQNRLEQKREKELKEKELLEQELKQKSKRPYSAAAVLKTKQQVPQSNQQQTQQQNKEQLKSTLTQISQKKINNFTSSTNKLQSSQNQIKLDNNNPQENNSSQANTNNKDNKNFRVTNIINKSIKSKLINNNQDNNPQ